MSDHSSYDAILFDMDGVVIDSHDAVRTFWFALADQHGITITEDVFKQHIYGCTFDYTLDVVFSTLDADQRRAALAFQHDFENNHLIYTAMPGVITLLRALRGRVPVALVTSGDRAKTATVFAQLGLAETFDAYVTMEDVSQGKPDPQCYQLGAQRVNVPPERCIVFEDSRNGARAGLAAGCTVIGVQPPDNAQPLYDLGVHDVIRNFESVTFDNRTLSLPGGARYRLG